MSVSGIACDHVIGGGRMEDKKFTAKEDIKPWLQSYLLTKRGIQIVIERSDANKIIFKCKGGEKKKGEIKDTSCTRRRKTCPFKVRANFSLRSGQWSLVVMDDNHDHDVESFSQLPVLDMYNKGVGMISTGSNDMAVMSNSKTSTPINVFSPFTDLTSDALYNSETPKDMEHNKRKREAGSSEKPKKRVKSNGATNNSSRMKIMDTLRKEVNQLIDHNILSNKRFSESQKSFMLKLFTSQFFMDHRDVISVSQGSNVDSSQTSHQFLQEQVYDASLRFDLENERASRDNEGRGVDVMDGGNVDGGQNESLVSGNVKSRNKHESSINVNNDSSTTSINSNTSDSSGDSVDQLSHNVSMKGNSKYNSQKPFINSWLTTSSNAHTSGGNSNTNLIPLSPLLNDTDADYQNSHGGNNSGNHGIENLYHLPGISLNSSLSTNTLGNLGFSTQMSQIQNQSQQLPSFNTIQNQLPLSPNMNNNPSASSFANSLSNASLIPPISNSISNTLNPSHLLKSNSKGNVLNLNQSSSLMSIHEIKGSNSTSNYNATSNLASNAYNVGTGLNVSVGVSSPNNNIIHLAYQSMGSTYNKETGSSPAANASNNNSASVINGMGNLGDPGW